jgi:hypothetical protein
VQAWRQQFEKLESVDLRYDHQIIVNPDQQGTGKTVALTPAAAKAAMAAGVKRAAFIHVVTNARPMGPQPVKPAARSLPAVTKLAPSAQTPEKAATKTAPKPAKRVARHRRAPRKAVAKGTKTEGSKPQAKTQTPPSPANNAAVSNSKAKHPAGTKKPSAAVAKNQEQQDHP